MSDSRRQGYRDPTDPLQYAPPWVRDRDDDPRPEAEREDWALPPRAERRPPKQDRKPNPRFDPFADAVAQAMQESMEPEFVEAPAVLRSGAKRRFGLVAKLAVAAAAAGIAAVVVVMVVPSQNLAATSSDVALTVSSAWRSVKSALFPSPQRRLVSTLGVHDSSGVVDDPLPLGVTVSTPAPGATVTISGLAAGSRLTVGKRTNTNEWRVPAQEISGAMIFPPSGFVGRMDLRVELRGDEGLAQVSSFVRISWLREGASPPQPAPAQPSPSPWPAQTSIPQPSAPPARAEGPVEMDPRESAALVARAQALLDGGDLQAARLLLLRAVKARDGRAAYVLAKTYDAAGLRQFGSMGPQPDPVQARSWYQKAKEWGIPDAQRELDALARFGN